MDLAPCWPELLKDNHWLAVLHIHNTYLFSEYLREPDFQAETFRVMEGTIPYIKYYGPTHKLLIQWTLRHLCNWLFVGLWLDRDGSHRAEFIPPSFGITPFAPYQR